MALVGKGILFDTGGINLKPHKSMLDMHTDMSGSAVALASLIALSELRSPIAADAWLAAGEIPNVRAITACLRRQKGSLSDACRAVFER